MIQVFRVNNVIDLLGYQADSESTARSLGELECITSLDYLLGDGVGLWILLIVGILGIGIDGTVVLTSFVEEVELDGSFVAVLVALAADEPVVGALGLARYGDIVAGFCLQILGIVPVTGHVADELEGVVELLVVLRQVGSHLQRRIHRQVESQ